MFSTSKGQTPLVRDMARTRLASIHDRMFGDKRFLVEVKESFHEFVGIIHHPNRVSQLLLVERLVFQGPKNFLPHARNWMGLTE